MFNNHLILNVNITTVKHDRYQFFIMYLMLYEIVCKNEKGKQSYST